ncbi:oxidative stress survival, Svf1-like protein [Teratosphaeria nubilosa]|uniref:Oxidative stress survival, Svf1-like protein n=1 Tax=Teratosphaeria nubilosa TaxID=161662 RepID=A0A6G1KWH5_9PEZI|nr:oxidative stress survival, Svf1-like protein [Teratosphaeria nubilosa]
MLNWAKNAVGITEPIYGPSAIQSVAEQTQETTHTELTKTDLAWEIVDGTNVETKTFYMISDEGNIGLAQVIYSNVMGVRTTAQFNSKIFAKDGTTNHLWSTDNLSHFEFSKDKQNITSKQGVEMSLSEDGKSYSIKSTVNKNSVVDLKFTQAAPGFAVGRNGTSTFGTDRAKPWGRMRHAFWPRCKVEGHIMTKQGPVRFNGRGIFIHALQGMKPHFAAARWNFCNFQSPSYSAVLMEYTTPKSYAETVVAVGGIVTDSSILMAGASPAIKAEHTQIEPDKDNGWPEPSAAAFTWTGKTSDGKDVSAKVEGGIRPRIDRVDVMGELPKFVKQIATSASGTKPYIYQYTPKMKLKINIAGEQKEEEGLLLMEATFIS